MVTEEEIAKMAAMMRIPIGDRTEYVDKVQKMLDYFGVLDSAGVDDEDVMAQEVAPAELRADEYHGHEMGMGGHIRAPRLG
jgi:aspartyl-tRNA(Asn)/glutamyl-tRNA(Gln) amidotransferase subunit C